VTYDYLKNQIVEMQLMLKLIVGVFV